MSPVSITLITGFLGSGKTTLLLSLLPQLPATYKLALLKNEFGDLAVDSQLAASSSISGVRELLNGCICCNLVGDIGPALQELRENVDGLQRVVIETSGSAFPATLAMEVNRLSRETHGTWILDGVVGVVDVENWKGYEDTSYTAKLQARYTDLIVFNKWEGVSEQRFDECLDRLGDLEVQTAWVKSDRGSVPLGLVFGIDDSLAKALGDGLDEQKHNHEVTNGHAHKHENGHQSEVEVLSVTLRAEDFSTEAGTLDTKSLEKLLKEAPRDEVYRITNPSHSSLEAIFTACARISDSDTNVDHKSEPINPNISRYILNWAFGRWTCTPMTVTAEEEHASSDGIVLRMTMILARFESTKWKKRIEKQTFISMMDGKKGVLEVEKVK